LRFAIVFLRAEPRFAVLGRLGAVLRERLAMIDLHTPLFRKQTSTQSVPHHQITEPAKPADVNIQRSRRLWILRDLELNVSGTISLVGLDELAANDFTDRQDFISLKRERSPAERAG
jgi:hypothetical protein